MTVSYINVVGLAQARAATKVFFEADRGSLTSRDYLDAFAGTDRLFRIPQDQIMGKPLVEIALAAAVSPTKCELTILPHFSTNLIFFISLPVLNPSYSGVLQAGCGRGLLCK